MWQGVATRELEKEMDAIGLTRRSLLVGSGALLATGCATTPPSPATPGAPITLVSAFSGRIVGRGRFQVPLAGVDRGLRAVLNGQLSGDVLSVAEDFAFDDGERKHLTWRFTRIGTGAWTGRREDVVGEAQVRELGHEIRLSYEADVAAKGSTRRLQFADVLYRRADGVIVNDAVVRKAGIPVGSIHLEFSR